MFTASRLPVSSQQPDQHGVAPRQIKRATQARGPPGGSDEQEHPADVGEVDTGEVDHDRPARADHPEKRREAPG